MSISNVSFGRVVAVSGKPNKMEKINNRLFSKTEDRKVMMKDVTKKYAHASSSGLLAQAAQKGHLVQIYITGDDIANIKTKEKGWTTIDGILSNLEAYYKASDFSVDEIVNKIL